jgi:dGTP triphosphohydrolase
MILGPDGQTPIQTANAENEEAARRKELCEKVYIIFAHEAVSFEEGADVGANLMVNYVTNQPDFVSAQAAARQIIGTLTQIFQKTLQDLLTAERVRQNLHAANEQRAPS